MGELAGGQEGVDSTRRRAVLRLSPDYNADVPLWPASDDTCSLVPEPLLTRLTAWQQDFDSNFRWDTGWCSDEAKVRWAEAAVELERQLREVLTGKAELIVDLWPLQRDALESDPET